MGIKTSVFVVMMIVLAIASLIPSFGQKAESDLPVCDVYLDTGECLVTQATRVQCHKPADQTVDSPENLWQCKY